MKITKEDGEFIKANYKGVTHEKMVKLLLEHSGHKYSETAVGNFYRANGLKSGLDGRFKQGCDYQFHFQKGFANLSEDKIARIKSTQYKKGNIPWNHKEVGTITKGRRRRGSDFSWIKVGEKNWQLEHVYVWEQAHGKVPPNGRIVHLDGDSYNNKLENLMLIDNAQLAVVNHIGLTKDTELNKTIIYTVKLMDKLKE